MKQVYIIILAITFLVLIASYYVVFNVLQPFNSYINHPFWFGMPSNIVKIIVVFQILGLIGIILFSSIIFNHPKTGILKTNLFIILLIFLISSIIWPFATYYNYSIISICSIHITSICSILLLTGTIQNTHFKWNHVLGALLLCIVTVLCDSVLWNTNYIYNYLPKNKLTTIFTRRRTS
jgi:hypothetical protein